MDKCELDDFNDFDFGEDINIKADFFIKKYKDKNNNKIIIKCIDNISELEKKIDLCNENNSFITDIIHHELSFVSEKLNDEIDKLKLENIRLNDEIDKLKKYFFYGFGFLSTIYIANLIIDFFNN